MTYYFLIFCFVICVPGIFKTFFVIFKGIISIEGEMCCSLNMFARETDFHCFQTEAIGYSPFLDITRKEIVKATTNNEM